MKGTSLESSRGLSLPEPSGTALSVLLHVLLVTGAFAASSHIASKLPDDTPQSAQFLYPLLKPEPRPVEEHIEYIGLGGVLPAQVVVRAAPAPVNQERPMAVSVAPVEKARVPEPAHTFSEIEVDSAAVRDPSSEGPVYPRKLLQANIEGATVVQFVVDSLGHVDQSTIRVLESSHPAFTEAVRDVLPRMKYQPARIGRRPVAQTVEQRFGFRIAQPS